MRDTTCYVDQLLWLIASSECLQSCRHLLTQSNQLQMLALDRITTHLVRQLSLQFQLHWMSFENISENSKHWLKGCDTENTKEKFQEAACEIQNEHFETLYSVFHASE